MIYIVYATVHGTKRLCVAGLWSSVALQCSTPVVDSQFLALYCHLCSFLLRTSLVHGSELQFFDVRILAAVTFLNFGS
jgi:hypothetical protein